MDFFNNLNKVTTDMRSGMTTDSGMPRNTSVVNAGDKVIASYYAANIVTVTANTVTIDNGGYDTRSTYKFINAALTGLFGSRCKIYKKKGETFVDFDGQGFRFDGKLTLKPTDNGAELVS